MYCPNCGQQQISDEMRFCSRCGLALTGLADWLAGGRVQPVEQTQVPEPSPRRKNMRRAAKLMFFSGVLFAIFLVISLAIDEGGPMFIPCFVFFVSLVWMLYIGLGDRFNKRAARALPRGGFHFLPGKEHHYAFTTGRTIIQINGDGPFDINYVDPADDPQKAKM